MADEQPGFPTIQDVADFLEAWAPLSSAQSYDNVGLQVGNPSSTVRRGLIALDMVPGILEEARGADVDLIVTHHPLLFHPLRSVTPLTFSGGLAYGLASSGIALYSVHTNLDAAPGGVSFALGRQLGLRDMDFLERDVSEETGLGVIGRLDQPETLADFLDRVAHRLHVGSVRFAGDLTAIVERVAACGGAGKDLADRALRAGADVYVTSDVPYHAFFGVLDGDGRPRMAFVDAGHYETEVVTESLLEEELSERFPSVEWRRTRMRTTPVQVFVRKNW